MMTDDKKRELYDELSDKCKQYGCELKNVTICCDGWTERLFITVKGQMGRQEQPRV